MNGKMSEIKPVAPIWTYFAVSISNVVATTCQYEALKYVSFPVQTLGKCAKMLPVMIWGIFILRKRYGVKDFLIALSVTAGCTIFLLTGEVKSKVRVCVCVCACACAMCCTHVLCVPACKGFKTALSVTGGYTIFLLGEVQSKVCACVRTFVHSSACAHAFHMALLCKCIRILMRSSRRVHSQGSGAHPCHRASTPLHALFTAAPGVSLYVA